MLFLEFFFYGIEIEIDGLLTYGTSGGITTGLKLRHSGQKVPNNEFGRNLAPVYLLNTVSPLFF